jgi:membrane protein
VTPARPARTRLRLRGTVARFLSLRWIRDVWMYLVRILERMEDNNIFLSGAAIAFNTLLCFIPLVLLIFFVLGFTLDTATAIATIDSYIDSLQLFPFQREQLRGIVVGLLREFVRGSSIAGIVGAIGLLWTSSALFAALRAILNRIFHARDTRNIVVSKLKDLAMLSLVGVALMIMTLFMYGSALVKSVAEHLFSPDLNRWLFGPLVFHVSSFVLSFLIFCLIFLLLPDRRLPVRVIAIASGIAALLWGVAKGVFSYYVTNLWSMGSIYGPYAILAALAIWVYYSGITLLLAAEIGQMADERRTLRRLFRECSLLATVASFREPALRYALPAARQSSESGSMPTSDAERMSSSARPR